MSGVQRQEINLLFVDKKPSQPFFSFRIVVSCSILFCSILTIVFFHQKKDLDAINVDIKNIEKNNMFQQAQAIPTDSIGKYENQLKKLEKQLLDRYQLWANYQKITMTGKDGFSKHFYHIAQLSHVDLSLYEIDIYNKGKNLSLKGYARKPEDIPIYINELKKQKEFEGVKFGDLNIEKIKDHNVMRFSLEKNEEEKKETFDNKPDINISDLMGMPLVSRVGAKELLKGKVRLKEVVK